MTMVTLLQQNIYLWLAYIFRGILHDHHDHGGKHGAGGVESFTTEDSRSIPHWCTLSTRDLKAHPHSDILPLTQPHLFQQGQTS